MLFWVLLALIVVGVFLIWLCVKNRFIYRFFSAGNVVVFGMIGSGKDLIFQKVSNYFAKHKKHIYSNVNYGNCEKLDIRKMSIAPNSHVTLVDGKIYKIPPYFKEDSEFFISDCGVYLPSQFDSENHKIFPGFSGFYALVRHLYNGNIHCNSQNLSRVWKPLREQADFFILAKGVIKLPGFLLVKYTAYDNENTALLKCKPLSKRNKDSASDIYRNSRGLCYTSFFLIRKSRINYDSRFFRCLLADSEAVAPLQRPSPPLIKKARGSGGAEGVTARARACRAGSPAEPKR